MLVAGAIVQRRRDKVSVDLLNPFDDPVCIPRGSNIEVYQNAESTFLVEPQVTGLGHCLWTALRDAQNLAVQRRDAQVKKQVKAVTDLSHTLQEDEREKLYDLFVKYKDVFASSSIDYGETDLPHVHDIIDCLAGSNYFSGLDLISGYWQILMNPESREKTAFVTEISLPDFVHMRFGLTNFPATFQRLMENVMFGLQ